MGAFHWIFGNFRQRMEQHFPTLSKKRTTSQGVPKFAKNFSLQALLPEFLEFLVEWFAFQKFKLSEFLETFPGNFCTICRFFQIFESFVWMESAPYEGNKCVGRPKNYLSLQALYAVFTNKKSSILKEGRVPSKQLRSGGVLMEVNQVSCHILNWITKVKSGSWRKIWKSCHFGHLHFARKDWI